MSDSAGLELLVATGDQSFTATVSEELATLGAVQEVAAVDSADPALSRVEKQPVDGVVIDDTLEDPVATADRLTSVDGTEVVLLTDGTVDTGEIETALDAGVTDVFPRTTASTQYELIVDRIENETQPTATADGSDDAPRESERRLRAILERIDEAIYVTWADELTNPSLHPEDFYAGYEDVWGRPLEEIFDTYEEGFFGTLHPEERPGFRSFVANIGEDLTSGSVSNRYSREYRIERADGEVRWIRSDFYPTEWETGPLRMVIVSRDITERKRRQREYEQIFNSVQDAITVHDPHTGEMVNVNDTFCELVGYDRVTILEIGTTGVSVEEEGYTQEYAEQIIAEVMSEGQKGPYEWMVETDDGERRVTEVVATKGEIGGEDRIISINRDITERKRREREYEQIFNMAGDGIVIHDPDSGDIVDVNQQVADLLGYDRETFFDRPMSEFQATEEGVSGRQAREKVRESAEEGRQEFEWPLETSDGETVWVRARHETGEIDGERRIVAILQDVTERKRREQEYEQIFNGVKDAILVIDPETLDILDANEAYLDLVGYGDLETVQAVGIEGMIEAGEGSTIEQARRLHERVAETEESELVEWRAETSEGDRLWLEIEISPAVINGEGVTIAIHRDVTERRQLERRFRTIGERVDEVIYLSNIDLNEVLYINDAYTDIWGRPVDEIYENPRAFVESIHPDDVETFREKRQAMLEDIRAGDPDDSYDFSYRIERPDGELRWIESTGYPIVGEGGEPNRYVAMVEDVTEQHRREQTLETFHEATRRLTAADTHEHACRQAVQAAQDVLGFPLVAAYLYDDETGTLEPTARTDRLETLDVDLRPFGPGDSLPWQVFVEGESVTSPDRVVDIYGPGVSSPDVIVPLGSHGVMFVGAPGEAFDGEDVELARILAATLEAALNHVAGEETLAEREKELKRQQERAARLERLNAIIRDIERVTVEQSSRSGIESAVCERLIDVDTHGLVWIGERTVGDEELRIRDTAGDKDAYIDALSAELASEAAGHPAVAVRRNDQVGVVENVATDVSPGDWRTMALRHGIQSVVSVPIRYETTLHGVLTVASGEPDAFDEATRDVLAELGRSIGYAITVTEREEALESEGTTELEFDTDDDGLFMIRGSDRTASEIRLERTVRRSGGSFSMFYRVEGADPSDVADLATAAPSVENAQVVSTDDDEQLGLVDVTAPTWFGSVFTEHGAVVREATAENGSGTVLVEVPRGADVRSLVDGFQQRYPDSDLAAQRQRERAIRSLFELQDVLQNEVTDRQWEALETAYSAGYFAWPRETSGKEVAELIGVTQPTFNKHLRIAERAAFRLLLEREYPDAER